MPFDSERTARVAAGIRRRVLSHVLSHEGGYLSQAASSAEILATLYTTTLRLGPPERTFAPAFSHTPGPGRPGASGAPHNGPRDPAFDRFFFSPVHYALVLYATLVEVGRLDQGALETFNQDGSTVEMIGAEHSPGHEVTAGSLAQTWSQAAGVAWARRRRGDPGRVVVFLSDGELQEGQTWETVAAAAWTGLDNLVAVIDANGQQCDGAMSSVMNVEPALDRLRSFGASAAEVDGHDIEALHEALAFREVGRPRVVLARTDPCRGFPPLEARRPRLHYTRFPDPVERARFAALLEA